MSSKSNSRNHSYSQIVEVNQNIVDNKPLAVATLMTYPVSSKLHFETTTTNPIVVHPVEDSVQVVVANSKCNDLWAAVLFIINILVLIYMSFQSKFSLVAVLSSETSLFYLFMCIIGLIGFSMLIGVSMLLVMIHHSESIIQFSLWTSVVISGISSVFAFATGQIIVGAICLVFTALSLYYRYVVQSRIPFTAVVLKTACTVLENHLSAILMSTFSILLLEGVFALVWTKSLLVYVAQSRGYELTSTTIGTSANNYDFSTNNGLMFVWFTFTLFWTFMVLKNIIHVTVAGTVATWWFHKYPKHVVLGAFFRACSVSLGTICFGSLLIAIVHTLREILNKFRTNRRDRREDGIAVVILTCIASCILECLEGLMVYINRYALCYTAVYGEDFLTSGKSIMQLFEQRLSCYCVGLLLVFICSLFIEDGQPLLTII